MAGGPDRPNFTRPTLNPRHGGSIPVRIPEAPAPEVKAPETKIPLALTSTHSLDYFKTYFSKEPDVDLVEQIRKDKNFEDSDQFPAFIDFLYSEWFANPTENERADAHYWAVFLGFAVVAFHENKNPADQEKLAKHIQEAILGYADTLEEFGKDEKNNPNKPNIKAMANGLQRLSHLTHFFLKDLKHSSVANPENISQTVLGKFRELYSEMDQAIENRIAKAPKGKEKEQKEDIRRRYFHIQQYVQARGLFYDLPPNAYQQVSEIRTFLTAAQTHIANNSDARFAAEYSPLIAADLAYLDNTFSSDAKIAAQLIARQTASFAMVMAYQIDAESGDAPETIQERYAELSEKLNAYFSTHPQASFKEALNACQKNLPAKSMGDAAYETVAADHLQTLIQDHPDLQEIVAVEQNTLIGSASTLEEATERWETNLLGVLTQRIEFNTGRKLLASGVSHVAAYREILHQLAQGEFSPVSKTIQLITGEAPKFEVIATRATQLLENTENITFEVGEGAARATTGYNLLFAGAAAFFARVLSIGMIAKAGEAGEWGLWVTEGELTLAGHAAAGVGSGIILSGLSTGYQLWGDLSDHRPASEASLRALNSFAMGAFTNVAAFGLAQPATAALRRHYASPAYLQSLQGTSNAAWIAARRSLPGIAYPFAATLGGVGGNMLWRGINNTPSLWDPSFQTIPWAPTWDEGSEIFFTMAMTGGIDTGFLNPVLNRFAKTRGAQLGPYRLKQLGEFADHVMLSNYGPENQPTGITPPEYPQVRKNVLQALTLYALRGVPMDYLRVLTDDHGTPLSTIRPFEDNVIARDQNLPQNLPRSNMKNFLNIDGQAQPPREVNPGLYIAEQDNQPGNPRRDHIVMDLPGHGRVALFTVEGADKSVLQGRRPVTQTTNENAFGVDGWKGIFGIGDGLGGHGQGDIASGEGAKTFVLQAPSTGSLAPAALDTHQAIQSACNGATTFAAARINPNNTVSGVMAGDARFFHARRNGSGRWKVTLLYAPNSLPTCEHYANRGQGAPIDLLNLNAHPQSNLVYSGLGGPRDPVIVDQFSYSYDPQNPQKANREVLVRDVLEIPDPISSDATHRKPLILQPGDLLLAADDGAGIFNEQQMADILGDRTKPEDISTAWQTATLNAIGLALEYAYRTPEGQRSQLPDGRYIDHNKRVYRSKDPTDTRIVAYYGVDNIVGAVYLQTEAPVVPPPPPPVGTTGPQAPPPARAVTPAPRAPAPEPAKVVEPPPPTTAEVEAVAESQSVAEAVALAKAAAEEPAAPDRAQTLPHMTAMSGEQEAAGGRTPLPRFPSEAPRGLEPEPVSSARPEAIQSMPPDPADTQRDIFTPAGPPAEQLMSVSLPPPVVEPAFAAKPRDTAVNRVPSDLPEPRRRALPKPPARIAPQPDDTQPEVPIVTRGKGASPQPATPPKPLAAPKKAEVKEPARTKAPAPDPDADQMDDVSEPIPSDDDLMD